MSAPRQASLLYFLWLACIVALWFLFVYGSCDWITKQHSYRVPLAMAWEQQIPFVPVSVLGYMSLYPLFLLVPLVLRERRQLRSFGQALFVLITLAGIGFLLFPGEPRDGPMQSSSWRSWIAVADAINLTYNFAPSLHVGLSVGCVAAMAPRVPRLMAALLWCWAIVIAASTLLLHQHYAIDVVSAWLLAVVCVHMFVGSAARTRQPAGDASPEPLPSSFQAESGERR